MHRFRAIRQRPGALAHRIDVGRALAVIVAFGLALMMTLSLVAGVAVGTGTAPEIDLPIVLYAQHRLVIRNGPSPTCVSIPNPPQHDCFRPGPERREFSVVYLTPNGVRSLVRVQLSDWGLYQF